MRVEKTAMRGGKNGNDVGVLSGAAKGVPRILIREKALRTYVGTTRWGRRGTRRG